MNTFSASRRLKAIAWLMVTIVVTFFVIQGRVPDIPVQGQPTFKVPVVQYEQAQGSPDRLPVQTEAGKTIQKDHARADNAHPPDKRAEEDRQNAGESYPPCTRHVDTERAHVIVMADRKSLIGLVALANSIVRNTESDVMFHFVTFPSDAALLRRWINGSELSGISHQIVELSRERLEGKFKVRSPRKDLASPMNFARVLLTDLLPCVGKVVFIDADCLVVGDIRELYDFKMDTGHMAAGVNMCDFNPTKKWPTMGLVLNQSHPLVQKSHIPKDSCMMNGGMYVADLMQWEKHNISEQLQHWMELNTREPVFKFGDFGSGTQAVLNAVLHSTYSSAPKEWNTVSGFHKKITDPKMIHWNGAVKPWLHPSVSYFDEWMKFYVADPDGRIKPRNLWRERKEQREAIRKAMEEQTRLEGEKGGERRGEIDGIKSKEGQTRLEGEKRGERS